MLTGATQIQRHLFSVAEYDRMVEAGVFGEDDRLELIEGEVVAMSPTGSAHAGRVNRLTRLFTRLLGERALVSVQNPIRLEHSEPQPDLALLRPRADDYVESHPEPGEVLLIVEVADTTVEYDRTVKIPLYGRSGICEAWLVDLSRARIETYRGPSPAGYEEMRAVAGGEAITLLAWPDVSLTADDVLKPPSA